MKKKSLYYYLGALLIIIGCVGYFVIIGIGLELIIALLGIVLVILSDKKWWLKILTILLLPPISVYTFIILIFALSDGK